jgi:hypothetical protein
LIKNGVVNDADADADEDEDADEDGGIMIPAGVKLAIKV